MVRSRRPSPWLLDFATELLKEERWKEHVKDLVYMGHEPFIRSLVDKGIMAEWLNTGEKDTMHSTMWMLQSIKESCGDMVAQLLEPLIDKGKEWNQSMLTALWADPKSDTDRLFELRLKLAASGFGTRFIRWKRLAEKHPLRVVRLLDTFLSTWKVQSGTETEDESQTKRTPDEGWDEKDDGTLGNTARQHAETTWDTLFPHVERFTNIGGTTRRPSLHDWKEDGSFTIHEGHPKMSRCVVRMLSEAAKALAKQSPEAFLSRARGLSTSSSQAICKVLINGYSELPPIHADAGVEWLLEDLGRLRVDSARGGKRWTSVRLIQKLSPYCSDTLFHRFEHALVHYHSPQEKELARYYLEKSREGYYGYWYGEAQYFLLPALAPRRRSDQVNSLIRVLKRKFGEGERFLQRSLGGEVVSPLRTEILPRISDRAWLADGF